MKGNVNEMGKYEHSFIRERVNREIGESNHLKGRDRGDFFFLGGGGGGGD